MMLDLDHAEAEALLEAFDGYLPVLAEEAARTDRVADAHELWNRYRRLEALRARLRTALEDSAPLADFP